MLVDELRMLAGNPLSWGAAALLGLFALYSILHWLRCPVLARTARIDPAVARAYVDRPVIAGPRYLFLMLAGVAATLAGLTLIAEGLYPALAFYLLLAGVFAIQTEPARLRLRESAMRVIVAEGAGEAARAQAVARLRAGHMTLVTVQLVLLAAVVVFLLSV